MNDSRNIEAEMETERDARRQQNNEWEPWGPLDWPEGYGDYEFFADRLKRRGKYSSAATLRNARKKALEFQDETGLIEDITEFENYEAERFFLWMQNEENLTNKTINMYIGALNSLADFYSGTGYYDGNPFSDIESLPETGGKEILENSRVEVQIEELRSGIKSYGVKNVTTVLILLLAKSGARLSEICNLDDRDIHIDHPIWDDVSVRPKLQNRPDTIFISPNTENSRESINADTYGNKRVVPTIMPIDNELKRLLVWYLAAPRPKNFSDESPFIRSNKERPGQRLSIGQGGYAVRKWSKANGLYTQGGNEMENVTAHWFRSFFTTSMKTNISTGDIEEFPVNVEKFVKGLRGDSGDLVDRYTQIHDNHRKIIVEAQPKFNIR